mmetsp:Transcript_11881/g.28338  ORF Transcript_11881/g.28338 Transcript_11881/m.28338 type:complete len:436 (+) Transcript_11881:88-1395(+)
MMAARMLAARAQLARVSVSALRSRAVATPLRRWASMESLEYPGGHVVPFSATLKMRLPEDSDIVEAYQVLDPDGSIREGAVVPEDLSTEDVVELYEAMVRLSVLDNVFNDAQRQGRISFYMQQAGEEAIHMGSARALTNDDVIFAQYREAGVLMWRGFTLQQFADQCFSNEADLGKGRQMPIHYGSKELNYVTISSPLATQLPQASGAAYALKLKGGGTADAVAVCYCGDGAASEGDFHAALNFAATLHCPIVFFFRNNGFAISTPIKEQVAGDGLISRAAGYGMASIRCDGNDLFAVYEATKAAKELALAENRPVMVEAMTYRLGHHSTSDDSTRYRSSEELEMWRREYHPIDRVRGYLEKYASWDDEKDAELQARERKAVLQALAEGERKPKPHKRELFTDVYVEKPRHLVEQEEAMLAHTAKYSETYDDSGH